MKKNIQKKWWKSKTLWANTIIVIIGVLSWIRGQIDAGVAITAFGILNAALRVITKKKLVK